MSLYGPWNVLLVLHLVVVGTPLFNDIVSLVKIRGECVTFTPWPPIQSNEIWGQRTSGATASVVVEMVDKHVGIRDKEDTLFKCDTATRLKCLSAVIIQKVNIYGRIFSAHSRLYS